MAIPAATWQSRVAPHFSYLVSDYGFALTGADNPGWWQTWVQYSSDVSAVRVIYSFEFQCTEVELIRLVAGSVPAVEVWATNDAETNWILLDNVIEVRAPDRLKLARSQTGLGDDDVERQLSLWAAILAEVAGDFLSGDRAVFADVDRLIKGGVRKDPQQLIVWLPQDASSEDEAAARLRADGTTPPGVEVVVRRYSC